MKNISKNMKQLFLILMSFIILAPAHAEATPLEVVKNTSDQVIERLKNESDPQKINQAVNDLIAPNFDFPKMSRWVLGKNWRKASSDQQTRFTGAFQKLLIKTYSKALVESDNVEIKYLPVHAAENSKKVTVKTEVDRQNGGPFIPINYRLYKAGNGWKVYDVSIDGVSLVSTYRGSFNDEIKRKGLEALITDIESRS